MTYAFNGATLRITLSSVTQLSLPDLYSRYKDWVLAGNASSLTAFGTVGGEIAAIPLYLFLTNGWRIIPMASDHVLTVTDGILEVAEGGDPFVDPAGTYKIRINRQTPGIAIGYATGSGVTAQDKTDIAAATLAAAQVTPIHSSPQGPVLDLAKINGLVPGTDAVVADTGRTAGDVTQTFTDNAGVVTIART